MIVAIEGTSAAGKTTWCRTHAAALYVPEEPPGRERWRLALEGERLHGLAVCDTDPAKLYYDYALWRSGRIDHQAWRASCAATRDGFAAGELGLPDLIFFAELDAETLERRRASDPTRRRRRFRLHLELQPLFVEWWQAVDALDPGRVVWRHPVDAAELRPLAPRTTRTGAELFDSMLALATTGRPNDSEGLRRAP